MKVDYESYKFLKIMRPAPGILEVVMSNPGKLNALDRHGHAELAEIWRDVDADPDVSCVLLRGEGGNYSAGGDLGLVEEMVGERPAISSIT
jgi:enoyl-CoA hydratase